MDSNSKIKANITIKGAKNLPKLGLTAHPSSYTIMKIGQSQETTKIYPSSCNPSWNYSTELESEFQLEKVTFYVFNNNRNHVDQLLGVGVIEFENFMTPVVTGSRVMLQDAEGNYLASWIELQHCDANPKPNTRPPPNQRTTLRITLLSITTPTQHSETWLSSHPQKNLTIQYGSQTKQFISDLSTNTFKYDPSQPEIHIGLDLGEKVEMNGVILVENVLGGSGASRVRMYWGCYQVVVLVGVGVVTNGLLPDKHNVLLLEISHIMIEPIKKLPKEWSILIHSIYNSQLIKTPNKQIRLYIENNTELLLEYFQQPITETNKLDYEPIASYLLSLNAINWGKELNGEEKVKMGNAGRGIFVDLGLRVELVGNQRGQGLLPRFQKPGLGVGEGSGFRVAEIRMTGACFGQIFTEKTQFYFVYMPNYGEKTVFPVFQLRNSIEYAVPCRQTIRDVGGGGQLWLVTFDHYFGKDQQNETSLSNHLIFKLLCKDLQDLSQSPILFQQKFLSFAKKQSLAKNCKKYQTMLRDKTLSLRITGKKYPLFQPGLLTIQNCRVEGGKVRVDLALVFDSNELRLEGEWGDFLLSKPYVVSVRDNGVQIKVGEDGQMSQVHFQFQEVFGCPEPGVVYSVVIPLPLDRKLTIIYTFTPTPQPPPPKPLPEPIHFLPSTPVHLKPKSALVPFETYTKFHLRITRSSIAYETLEENPSSMFIRFRDCEDMYFQGPDQSGYLFFQLYCRGKEGELVIYAGHYCVRNLMGRGDYQLVLIQMGNEQKKNQASITFQVLNNPPPSSPQLRLTPKHLSLSHPELLKPIMKYYLTAEINNNPISIFQLTRLDNTLVIAGKEEVGVLVRQLEDLVGRVYCGIRQIPRDGFWGADKELIAVGKMEWTDLEESGMFNMRFLPNRELNTKMSANKLALLENVVAIQLSYSCQPLPQTPPTPKNTPLKPLQLDVLHTAACKLTIWQILPFSSHKKTLQLQLLLHPLEFPFTAQSRFLLNKQFILQLSNMKLKLGMTRSSKLRDRYGKVRVEREIGLRGRRARTGDRIGVQVEFLGIGVVKADVVVMSTKFTSQCRGVMKLTKMGSESGRIKQAQIYPLQSQSQLKYNLDSISPFRVLFPQPQTPITFQFPTSSMDASLFFILTLSSNPKIRSLVPLAEIPIDRLEDKPFRYEWLVETEKGGQLVWIQGEYRAERAIAVQGERVGYLMVGDGGERVLEREFRDRERLGLLRDASKVVSYKPDRKRGYRVVVKLPQGIEVSSVSGILPNNETLPLLKSIHNPKIHTHTGPQAPKILTLHLKSPTPILIEQLQQKNFTRRFLLNRNPSLIATLQQQPYAIADTPPQSIIVQFCFHEVVAQIEGMSQGGGKIMWMANNKYDQILTKKFGLLVQCGKQRRIVRGIDERGQYRGEDEDGMGRRVRLGFQAEVDELEMFLFISHVLNQNEQAQALQCQQIQNWTKLFPVAYGKLPLQKAPQHPLIGCQLTKLPNFNPTLDNPLNNSIIRPQLSLLGSITLEQHHWGFISIQLQEISALELERELEFPVEGTLLYLELVVENGRRDRKAGLTTEAREFVGRERVRFGNCRLGYFYVEEAGDQGQSLRIVGTLLTFNNSIKLFQKRVDLTEYLHNPGTHRITTQQKPQSLSQPQSLKSPLQLTLTLTNSPQPHRPPNPALQALTINTVDMISFEDYKEEEMIEKLVQCQQASHLVEIMGEVRESVLYSRESQPGLFRAVGLYLQFQGDGGLVEMLLDMMGVQLGKYPGVLAKLTETKLTLIYNYMKILFQCKQLQLPKVEKKISASQYSQLSQKPPTNLDTLLKQQKKHLYTPEQQSARPSSTHIPTLLPLLETFLQHSPIFRQLFTRDIQQWSQAMMYKEDAVFEKYVGMLTVVYGEGGMEGGLVEDVLKIGLEKDIPMGEIVGLWGRLPEDKLGLYSVRLHDAILARVKNNKSPQQSIQSYRTLLHSLTQKKQDLPPQTWKQANTLFSGLLLQSKDMLSLNLYGQLLVKLNSLGKLDESKKGELVGQLRKKIASEPDRNVKVCLGNLVDKLVGKKVLTVQEASTAKTQFYKKYLITS